MHSRMYSSKSRKASAGGHAHTDALHALHADALHADALHIAWGLAGASSGGISRARLYICGRPTRQWSTWSAAR
jgi:hypothetical protein